MALGERIKERRDALGWTQDQLAQRAGLSKGFLCDVENGNRGIRAEKLLDLARVLGVSTDYLMTGEGREPANPAHVEIPTSLARFAELQRLTFKEVLTLLKMRQQILAHRSSTDRSPDDDFDWHKFHESVKEFL